MSTATCPVCDYEYSKVDVDFCSQCDWNLSIDSANPKHLRWAKKTWSKLQANQKLLQPENIEQHLQLSANDQVEVGKNNNQERSQFNSPIQPVYPEFIEQYLKSKDQQDKDLINLLRYLCSEVHEIKTQLNINSTDGQIISELDNEESPEDDPLYPEIARLNNSLEIVNLVQAYNQNKPFAQQIDVEILPQIQVNFRGGSQEPFIFQKGRGNYCIISLEDEYYLVPKKKRVNEHNYKIVESLFECRDFDLTVSAHFALLKPGKVRFFGVSEQEKWELVEQGVLKF